MDSLLSSIDVSRMYVTNFLVVFTGCVVLCALPLSIYWTITDKIKARKR